MNNSRATAMPATPSSADPADAHGALSRRTVLKLSLAASGLLAAGGLVEYLEFQAGTGAPAAFELDQPGAYPVGSATHLVQAGAWLLRDERGLYAISTRCPHLGCTVQREADGFHCPCHGSQFAPDGQVLNGPAARPLSFLKLTVDSAGRLVVHTDQVTQATARLDA